MNKAEKERLAKVGKKLNVKAYIKNEIEAIRAQVGDKKVLLAMSGGVDSSVCAVLLHKAIGKNLTCVFVDHGCMRLNEAKEVKQIFKGKFGINLICVSAEKRFLEKAKGVTDPEQKRKIIGGEFVRVFEEEAKKLGKVEFLGQGTIYPDIVESGVGGHKAVKAHHNVGGLPKDIGFEGLVEPVKYLYKDEVRAVGKALGIPEYMVMRQPFPGPGLAVRCMGELTKEKLDILRKADFVFRDEMAKAKLDKKAQQFFAIMTNVRTVGVKNNARTYGYVIAIRAVSTSQFVKAGVVELPFKFVTKVAEKIATTVKGANRVVWDITPKPPATIEWE
ncbi:MAG: glutamine-hydrolyzing GMP synthase [Kiritimatiellae bacterium]|nr:glutamine-hydrolyzing GMP synthase [Kiritimatiellia bacterium]MBR3823131.1 glutamine-hydrolyzing GMP synthase [Kiritimatiellia bacterium]